jgi:hypothetical protein
VTAPRPPKRLRVVFLDEFGRQDHDPGLRPYRIYLTSLLKCLLAIRATHKRMLAPRRRAKRGKR